LEGSLFAGVRKGVEEEEGEGKAEGEGFEALLLVRFVAGMSTSEEEPVLYYAITLSFAMIRRA
jgi:hypothetical protein